MSRIAFLLIIALVQIMPSVIFCYNICNTFSGKSGLCVPFSECEYFKAQFEKYGFQLPKPVKNLIFFSRCMMDNEEVHLCCEINSVINKSFETDIIRNTESIRVVKQIPNDKFHNINQRGLEILQSFRKCGIRTNQKVSGGEAVKLAEFPWMALLKYDSVQQPFQCGGSIITDRYVLTAAHCVVDIPFELIGVRLGENDLNTDLDCQYKGRKRYCLPPAEDFGITETKPHPQYEKGRIQNDIALIKLNIQIVFKTHIKPICLPITPKAKTTTDDQRYYIAGWGTTENQSASNILLKAIVHRKPLEVCRNVFKTAPITENHICAGSVDLKDTCKGDSGGPLFFLVPFLNTPRYTQFGIVSFGGAVCGDKNGYPGIYSNVLDMLPWITHNID